MYFSFFVVSLAHSLRALVFLCYFPFYLMKYYLSIKKEFLHEHKISTQTHYLQQLWEKQRTLGRPHYMKYLSETPHLANMPTPE